MSSEPVIAVLISLDTKAAEAEFLRTEIERAGGKALLVDFGTHPANLEGDIPAEELAQAGGTALDELRWSSDRAKAIDTMMAGAAAWARKARADGRIDALISVGGSGGTAVGTSAMRALPFGVPKVMVSTVAASDVRTYVGTSDITMINSVVDFAGINPLSEPVLRSAAAAVVAMANASRMPNQTDGQVLVAASQFGVTTSLVETCASLLAARGVSLVPFHATGTGGQTMESLISSGKFAAVLDLTTTEWADEVVGGTLSAGPDRLGAAARAGIAQVVAPGALDMVNFFMTPVPEKFSDRNIHRHNANVALMRTTPDENAEIGARIAAKLNEANGPVTFLFPLRGVSALDAQGQPFFDPAADEALRAALKSHLSPHVRFLELDMHINDPEFAEAAVEALLEQLEHDEARHHA